MGGDGQRMPAKLVMLAGKLKGRSVPLPPEGTTVIGRSQKAGVTVPDTNLSRSHCSIEATAQGYVLADMNSTNGTYHNGKLTKRAMLRDGDRIVIGETEMQFRAGGSMDDSGTRGEQDAAGMAALSEADREVLGARTIAMPTAEASAAVQPTGRLKRVRFCDVCDVTVPKGDMADGSAREIAGRLLCADCIGRLRGKNLDAAGNVGAIVDQLRETVRRERGHPKGGRS